jgi:hypothetical protein
MHTLFPMIKTLELEFNWLFSSYRARQARRELFYS